MTSDLVNWCVKKISERISAYNSLKRRNQDERHKSISLGKTYIEAESVNSLKPEEIEIDPLLRNTNDLFYFGVSIAVTLNFEGEIPMFRYIKNDITWYEISQCIERDRIINAFKASLDQLNTLTVDPSSNFILDDNWSVTRISPLNLSLRSRCKNKAKLSMFTCPCEDCHIYILSMTRKQGYRKKSRLV